MTGILIGAIIPVLSFTVVEFVFNFMVQYDIIAPAPMSMDGRRMRTIALISICCNLIPFNIFKNKKWDSSLRGIVFPTLVYVIGWLFKYSSQLF
jgi:hypothetical protein